MKAVTATEARRRFAAIIEAAQKEPVMVQRRNREAVVVVSPEQYERIRRIDVEELQRLCERVSREAAARGMTEEILADILRD
jgi:prevent-host-death family protein